MTDCECTLGVSVGSEFSESGAHLTFLFSSYSILSDSTRVDGMAREGWKCLIEEGRSEMELVGAWRTREGGILVFRTERRHRV